MADPRSRGLQPSPATEEPADPDPVVRAYLEDVDESLIRKNLTLDIEARFRQLMQLQLFGAELRRARERAEQP
jgi:hypothetical protein